MEKRIEEFDILKGFGILTVVMFHSVFYNFQTYDSITRRILYFFGPFGTPVVVIFFFVSGFLGYKSYEKNKNPWNFISKKLKVFLPPYFLWSTIYIILGIYFGHYAGMSYNLNFWNILSGYLFATAYLPFYFLFALLILFIFTPYFFGIKKLMSLMVILFIFGMAFTSLYYIPQYYGHMIVASTITYRNPLLWAFFYLWGMYASKNGRLFWTKIPSWWVWVGLCFSYAGTMLMILTVPKLTFDYEAYVALSPFEYLLYFFSMPVFLWISYLARYKAYSSVLSIFGKHSLDIYIDHVLIMGLILAVFVPFIPSVTSKSNFYIQFSVGVTTCLIAVGIGMIVKFISKKFYDIIF
ncbi:MAG: acyltransferase [Thermotogae bacterium]|jgi:fucose 4-O-acetylase-like acetyltransferase|nr:acyltransferase [Thermotogota bacterium]